MFQFPGFTFHKLCIHLWIHGVSHVSFLIRKSSDLWLCAPTRSLSQLITSFIGSWCQGIHHAPFVAWPIVMILVLKLSLQRIFLGYVVLTYLYNYVQFSKNNMVGLNGLEPSTSRLSGVRSNQLSYRPKFWEMFNLSKLNRKLKNRF